ncbi:Uncharacterized membrane protein [Noviherbaspirillum humi]|uniref:Uncharacterized membrane protein n=1 Tax=Noviherbaspirillum humi TaxID=1688639 RepID=A0A239G3Q8_9BURK|nr:DUF1345 domain-containing protein [Noviherbaspirillum humi]SNS63073.1 Uncharacterized membrane protein [Noviherbaspirillum humi]
MTSHRRQLLRSHPRLMTSLMAGTLVGVALPGPASAIVRILAGWNVAIWAYLALMSLLVARGNEERIYRLARQEDRNAVFVLAVMSLGAMLSLAAIVVELASVKNVAGGARLMHYGLTAATVIGSWLLLGTVYMFHYAHLYYRAPEGDRPLRFPDESLRPGYWDFLYFSFTIAVAAQTSDISIASTAMRKAVLAQSVLSFFFNAAIIGMSINIAAGVVGS